jgi:Tol biopolymer transport system component
MTASLWRVRRDGSGAEQLTDGTLHSGFPSYSADGKELVYRVWSAKEKGLRVLNLETRKTRVLTEGFDNLPGWSPDGKRIVFTRRREDGNYDVYTIRPDGTACSAAPIMNPATATRYGARTAASCGAVRSMASATRRRCTSRPSSSMARSTS